MFQAAKGFSDPRQSAFEPAHLYSFRRNKHLWSGF